jgi:hypothetical protein
MLDGAGRREACTHSILVDIAVFGEHGLRQDSRGE